MPFPLHVSPLYALFIAMAAITIATPGPAVLMTLTNTLRLGIRGAFGGILGLAVGILCVAALSATSLGVLLATTPQAFTFIRVIGAAYLIYLGLRLWRSPALNTTADDRTPRPLIRRFTEGVTLQLTSPNPNLFFLSVFPQFIEPQRDYVLQFAVLAITFMTLLLLIHILYATGARLAGHWLRSPQVGRNINRSAGSLFILFAVLLLAPK